MGNSENGKSSQTENSSSPAKLTKLTTPTNDHQYPDWAAIQAHYGPRVAMAPYYNYQLASSHAPHHYIWGAQQPIMTPYGAVYTHGNVYPHLLVPFMARTPGSMETPAKPSENGDKGLMKKLKSCDGLAMSLGNGGTESGAEDTLSQSVETGASDGNLTLANQMRRKRSREGTPSTGTYEKTETQANPSSDRKVKQENGYVTLSKQLVGPVVLSAMSNPLEVTSPSGTNLKTAPINGQQACPALPSEPFSQDEKELKRERRKQSNRESARRSRLRKQADAEELGQKVEFLIAENMSIKAEISQLAEKSEKLKLENASLMGRLMKTQSGGGEEVCKEESEIWKKMSKAGGKLHQVAASAS